MSLAMYLVDGHRGRQGAHARYQRAGHYTHREAQMIMYNTQSREPLGDAWQRAYDEITAKFPAILRKFFLERYQSAAHWCASALGTVGAHIIVAAGRNCWVLEVYLLGIRVLLQ